ncbi:hypothetical protein MES4922_110263 [Mesorhizobium ventifaucium]|uniref:Uncharacterized protein n=1 Tax=Mesorhizobium ventifaucium TaxID=666020 RepID=A0ABM9DE46_9HYPH|nr:hypothetical protein MES4922_110263 [Mesorhizobium ventifaucium]
MRARHVVGIEDDQLGACGVGCLLRALIDLVEEQGLLVDVDESERIGKRRSHRCRANGDDGGTTEEKFERTHLRFPLLAAQTCSAGPIGATGARQTFKRLEYLSTDLIPERPSEGRRRVDPENAGSLLADVAVMVRQLRPEHERISSGEIMALAIDDQLDPAGEHIADFLAGMLDGTFALAVRLDMMDIALQQVAGRIRNNALKRNAFAAPQRVERDQWPRACAEHDRLVVVDLFEHPADIGLQNFDQAVKHGQGWRSLAILDLGQKAFRAVRSCRQRLQRHAPRLAGEAQSRSKPRGIYGGVRFGLRPSPIDFVHPFANHSTVMGQLSREQKTAATDLQVMICQFQPSRASTGF